MKKPGAELASGFGGRWTEFKGDSGTKSKPTLNEALSVGIGFGSLIDRSIRVMSA